MNYFSMVTTSYSHDYTRLALSSFLQHTPLCAGDELLLIDNDGDFKPADMPDSPYLRLHRNDTPRSFAANVNHALRGAAEQQADLYMLNNDLVFSPGWFAPLEAQQDKIALPVSNVEFPYKAGSWELNTALDLQDYLGNESLFEAIAHAHCRRHQGFSPSYRPAYFCVKLPWTVYHVLGELDNRFGIGGAEDNDYTLRAWLAGFSVGYVLNSFVLHFHGKSTWRGPESEADRQARNAQYLRAFEDKWGEDLLALCIRGDTTVVQGDQDLQELLNNHAYGELMRVLVKRAGLNVEQGNPTLEV